MLPCRQAVVSILHLSEEMTPSESSESKCQAEKTPAGRCMDIVNKVSLPTQCTRY